MAEVRMGAERLAWIAVVVALATCLAWLAVIDAVLILRDSPVWLSEAAAVIRALVRAGRVVALELMPWAPLALLTPGLVAVLVRALRVPSPIQRSIRHA